MAAGRKSLPLWECGLKFFLRPSFSSLTSVTPFVGVWIEISDMLILSNNVICHSLCGSVD